MGSQEFIKGIERYCIWINDENIELALSILEIRRRIDAVREKRLESTRDETVELAQYPHRFGENRHVDDDSIIVPSVSSERRQYFPCGIVSKDVVISNLAFSVNKAPMYIFAVISSKMHIIWIRAACGQLETRLRYSNTLGYNTFPLPDLSKTQKQKLEEHAWDIIAAREAHPGKTIAWLYDPDTMPEDLLAAHEALDDTLEKIYIGRSFNNDTERLEHLFKLYAAMTAQKDKEAVNA